MKRIGLIALFAAVAAPVVSLAQAPTAVPVVAAQVAAAPAMVAPAPSGASPAIVAPIPAGAAPASVDADYKLGVSDQVRLGVYNEPDLSGDFTVSASGTLSMPLIGEVNVLNKTQSQVISEIQTRLADGYLKDPHVSLDVLTYRPFYILGEVAKPGEYPYSNGLTVLNAVATAQGFTYRANKKIVFVKHAGEGNEEQMAIKPDLQVRPGDTVRIGERYF